MRKLVLAAVLTCACLPSASAAITSFDGFPQINVVQPGNRTFSTPLTSDYVQGPLRPKWTRAMTDVGGWPAMYEFKNDIYLEFDLVDGHRGANAPGATGQLVRLRSSDQGQTWERLDSSAFGTRLYGEYVVKGDTLYRYEWVTAEWRNWISTSTDGVNFTAPVSVYEPSFIMYDVTYHEPTNKFYATPHYLPTAGDEWNRQVRLIESDNGFDWQFRLPLHSGSSSETALHVGDDGSMVAMVRQKWNGSDFMMVEGAPPYDHWISTPGNVELEGHQFFDVDGQLFIGSRAYLPAELVNAQNYADNLALGQTRQPYTAIYRVEDDFSLTLWAVLDSLGDNSYPRIVATDDEVLVAYYSQHEDGVDKVFLSAFDKDVFLGIQHVPEPSTLGLAAFGMAALALWRSKRRKPAG
jgi:hypothetical protein